MSEIGAFEAKNTLGTLLDRVEQGEEIVITRHGRRAARLIPYVESIDRSQVHAALRRIRSRAASYGTTGFDWEMVKSDRDAGRR